MSCVIVLGHALYPDYFKMFSLFDNTHTCTHNPCITHRLFPHTSVCLTTPLYFLLFAFSLMFYTYYFHVKQRFSFCFISHWHENRAASCALTCLYVYSCVFGLHLSAFQTLPLFIFCLFFHFLSASSFSFFQMVTEINSS